LAHRLIADALLADLESDRRIAPLLDVGSRP
jgi:hypothetical protein